VAKWLSALHSTGAGNREQPSDCHFSVCASAAEAGLTPLHCAAERTFGRVVGGFHAVFFEEGKKPFEVQEQCPGQIPHVFIATVEIAVGESEKLLLQRNGFPDQFLACDGSISDVRSGPEPVPQAKQTGMQRQCIAAEPLGIRRFSDLLHAGDIALEVRPAELPFALVVFQTAGITVAAQDTGKDGSQ
jgi:hypothetical protein